MEPTPAPAAPPPPPLISELSEEKYDELMAKQLANALNKVERGRSLSSHERKLIADARARGQKKSPEAPALSPSPPAPALPVQGTAGRTLSRTEIGELYSPGEAKAFFRTYNRCNLIGSLPEVRTPPPWHDPGALGEWYRLHYRSDPSKPAPGAPKTTLPGWIRAAITRGKRLPAPGAPAPSVPGPVVEPPSLFSVVESPADADPDADPPPLPDPGNGGEMSNTEALEFARAMLHRIRLRYEKVQQSPDQAPAAERAYFEALERVQLAERRARDAGDTETEMRRMVETRIDAVHHRLPRHLAQELGALRTEILRAAADPDTFPGWCAEFYAAVGERLARHRTLTTAA